MTAATPSRRVLVIVTGSSFSWLWGCFAVGFFKVFVADVFGCQTFSIVLVVEMGEETND